jgi:hypothetical protein
MQEPIEPVSSVLTGSIVLITIYQSATTLRVVVGKHEPQPPLPGGTARQYASLDEALRAETHPQARAALALLAQPRAATPHPTPIGKSKGRSHTDDGGPIEVERESQVPEVSSLVRPQASTD